MSVVAPKRRGSKILCATATLLPNMKKRSWRRSSMRLPHQHWQRVPHQWPLQRWDRRVSLKAAKTKGKRAKRLVCSTYRRLRPTFSLDSSSFYSSSRWSSSAWATSPTWWWRCRGSTRLKSSSSSRDRITAISRMEPMTAAIYSSGTIWDIAAVETKRKMMPTAYLKMRLIWARIILTRLHVGRNTHLGSHEQN